LTILHLLLHCRHQNLQNTINPSHSICFIHSKLFNKTAPPLPEVLTLSHLRNDQHLEIDEEFPSFPKYLHLIDFPVKVAVAFVTTALEGWP